MTRRCPPPAAPVAEDAELFRSAVGPVRPLPAASDARRETRRPPPPLPVHSQADERAVIAELLASDEALSGAASGEVLTHLQPGHPPKLLRMLRRGHFRVDAELDLHGLRVHQARRLLVEFLATCRHERRRCVRIIHGKGRGPEGSVLKACTDALLRQRAEVIGFTSARPEDGGTGAVMVLLSKAR